MDHLIDHPVRDLRAGDMIVTDSDTVLVESIERHAEPGQVRINGYIVRGWGRSRTKLRTWTKYLDQHVDVDRP